jgi:feruloyl esterase
VADLVGGPAAQGACEQLTGLKLAHASVTSAAMVAAAANLPAHCVVKATARPTSDSEIQFEVWLPASGWNGKYEQAGNGGWAGNIPVAAMAEPLRRGFAVAGTDDGHKGGTAEWAWGIQNWLISATAQCMKHVHGGNRPGVLRGEAERNYFVGCSDGGAKRDGGQA